MMSLLLSILYAPCRFDDYLPLHAEADILRRRYMPFMMFFLHAHMLIFMRYAASTALLIKMPRHIHEYNTCLPTPLMRQAHI